MPRSRDQRVTFDADDDVWAALPPTKVKGQYGARGDFLNQAVRQSLNPPIQVRTTGTDAEAREQINTFLASAESDILLVGISLQFLLSCSYTLLQELVRNHVALTVLLIPEKVPPRSALFEALRRRMGNAQLANQMLEQVRSSTAQFLELEALGGQIGTRVQVRTCDELPMYGLAVRDRLGDSRPTRRMRINVYSRVSVRHRHPVLEIDPTVPGGQAAYGVFDAYYEELLPRSVELRAPG